MKTKAVALWALCALGGHIEQALAFNLFSQVSYSGSANSPPPVDSLAVYDSTLDVSGLAGMPTDVIVSIPHDGGAIVATVHLEHMDRREGFAERDSNACNLGDVSGCEIIPYPGLATNLFSYTWVGRGDGYDLRLTIHRGNAVGVFSGVKGRFAISWSALKELQVSYFKTDDSAVYATGSGSPELAVAPSLPVPVMTEEAASAATIARFESKSTLPSAVSTTTQLDMLVLLTEPARIQAGGNPSDCRDTAGAMTYVYQNVDSMNTAFERSLISAHVGVVTVARLNGYTITPYTGNTSTIIANRNLIQSSTNVKAFRNAIGADVVSTLVDTQTNLGVCGVAYIQRADCGGSAPGCGTGPLFSDWTYLLETVQCSVMDTFTHELGHVLGAEHDHGHTSATATSASFPYSFGYGLGNSAGLMDGFETIMSQRFDTVHFPTRLLQFSTPNVSFMSRPTGTANTYENARTLTNLLPGSAAFRTLPNLIFASGFDEATACPAITF